jgi:membrane protease subunit (stomatin/prohibitin family)
MRGRGAALLVGMKMGENRAKQEQAAQQQAPPQQQQAAQPKPAAAPSAGGADMTAQLNNLNQMHQSGALSDEEYAAAKKKLLG